MLSYSPGAQRAAGPSAPADPTPEVAWPLTGLDASGASEEALAQPALAIKIENSEDARPQENLQYADVVYEEYVEAGISRLVAVYHSNFPESVGPVRSMRPMDKNIMGSYLGPLVFSGAQPGFISQNRSAGIFQISQDLGDYGFYRKSGRSAPHNLHAYPEDLLEQSGDTTTPPAQWAFAYPDAGATAQVQGRDVSSVAIIMSGWAHPGWNWDANSGTWLRTEWDAPHVTMDGTQLYATNIVIMRVDITYNRSGGGASVPETMLAGRSGSGTLISGSKAVDITWSKGSSVTDKIIYKTADGKEVSLMAGNTWVELIPNSGSVTIN